MDDILSQIIAYSPNKIDTEVKARSLVQGPRNMYAYAGIVKQGPNTGKHKYTDFYPKKTKGSFHEWFDSKKEMNEALQKRKEESGRGLTEKELTKKYKKEIEKRGYKTWGEVPENLKRSISTQSTPSKIARDQELPRFKKEGLSKRLNEKTRELLKTKQPINPKTGLPYTVKEYTELTAGQKMRLNLIMQGKKRKDVGSFYTPGSKKKGFYPEKDANRLINYMKIAAKQQEKLPIKERTFINVFEDKDNKKFIGVKDVKSNTLYTHVDYNLGKPGAKKGTVITKHPDQDKLNDFFKVAKKFKYERPEKLLGSYFKDYEKVPTYNEIYRFFTTNRNASVKTFQNNALTIQHQKLIGKVPTQNFQLLTNINNSKAAGIMRRYNRGEISKAKADYDLKKLGARQEGLGILQRDITPEKGLASAKKEAVKLFKDAYKVNPKIVEDITQKLQILGCPKSLQKASGGRIKFSAGSTCAIKGKKVLEQGLKNGFKESDQVLAKGILKSGKFLKDAVSLRGLFGPLALGFTVAAEAGLVGYDMLSSGKSFREAVGDSVFNYALGDKTKIDSEEEIIKRLQNIKTGPQNYQRMGDEEIGKMQYFKENLKDLGTGFDLYNKLGAIQKNRDAISMSPEDAFNKGAFQLDLDKQEDAVRADIRDYNKTGTPNRVTDYLLSDAAKEGADATALANLLVEQDRLQDAGIGNIYQSRKGDEKRIQRGKEIGYEIENLLNPNKLDEFGEYFISRPKSEQSKIMSYGYREGGIASLNVKK